MFFKGQWEGGYTGPKAEGTQQLLLYTFLFSPRETTMPTFNFLIIREVGDIVDESFDVLKAIVVWWGGRSSERSVGRNVLLLFHLTHEGHSRRIREVS